MTTRTGRHLQGTPLAALITAFALLGAAGAPADSPTIAPTETPLAAAALVPGEPVLVYRKVAGDSAALGIVGADGTLRTRRLPQGAEVRNLSAATSPDGRWLALCSGAGAVQRGLRRQVTLSLLDLTSGQVHLVTPLLAADVPANFERAAAALDGHDTGLPADRAEAAALLQDAFWQGMCSAAWSPDGRSLAFAGQMDGLSSDLYVYEMPSRAILRLTDDLEQSQSMVWSPDGRWILHSSAYRVGAGSGMRTSAVAADGSAVKVLSEGVITFRGWVDLSTYLQWDVTGNRLQHVDVETGRVTTLWNGTVASWAVDPVYGSLAIVGSEQAGRSGPSALFVLDLPAGQAVRVREAAVGVQYLGAGNRRFIASVFEGESIKPFFLTAESALEETWFVARRVVPSPDLRYVLVLGGTLAVYEWGNNPVREIRLAHPAQEIERLMWPPGSLTVFFTDAGTLYVLDLLGGDARPIDRAAGRLQETDYAFARPRVIGAEAVWDAERESEFADCHFESESPVDCVADVMRASGASPQALQFTRLLNGEAFMLSFEEHGTVDLARMMVLPRPSDVFQYVLLNGTPRIVFVAEDVGKIDIIGDPDYPRLAREYPELTIWESLNSIEGSEPLPGGGQRFIVRYGLVDGCHICRTGSSARVAFDFDRSGQFRGTRLLGLIE